MLQDYSDIVELVAKHNELRGPLLAPIKAKWWDENGTPRFADHHPKFCADIYADEVVLLQIACQACEERFRVQMSWSKGHELVANTQALVRMKRNDPTLHHPGMEALAPKAHYSLERAVRDGKVHYGDPPYHDRTGAQCSGTTMNVWDLCVLEFWRRPRSRGAHDWVRVPELEIALPDDTDPDRAP